MPVATRTLTRIQDLDDANVSLGPGVDEYALVYDHDTARFVLRAPAAAFSGLLATGATVGATSQAQAFTLGVVSPFVAPSADSTTAVQVRKADKTTAVVTVDTTNARLLVSSGYVSAHGAVQFSIAFTNPGAASAGLRSDLSVNHTTTISQDAYASFNTITKQGAGRVAGVMAGLYNYVLHSGTGQVDTARGLWNTVVKTDSGNIVDAQAMYCYQSFSGGGAITSSYGAYLANSAVSGVTLTTQYGLYVEALTTGATNYAIYTNAGKVRLGDIVNFAGTMGDSAKNPATDAPADWVQVEIGGVTHYIPAYAAS